MRRRPCRRRLAPLVALGLLAAWALGPGFALVALAYLALNLAYSFGLKDVVILDVLAIAIGFVLRAVAGALAIQVVFSDWLLVCTILLALFLALAKRRHELVTLEDAAGHRRILAEYSPYLLDQMIAVVTASCLTAYAFYTLAPGDGGEVPHRPARLDHPLRDLRDLPLSLPRPPQGAGGQPERRAAHRPAAARGGRPLGGGGGR